jgi:S-adenosylmethionine hydrolase
VVEAGGRWFVGPDNGLLSVVAARHAAPRFWRIDWRPERLSSTFHGRDLFAHVAAEIAQAPFPADKLVAIAAPEVEFDAGDLPRVVYVDHYGNAWTGIRDVARNVRVSVGGEVFAHAETFGATGKGEAFWYVNSVGLVEIAVNRGSAAARYGLKVGDPVQVHLPN